ncbi:HNH endonuclease [Roseinatronobacter alkalisoli]|uniref:Putative HNH nuclease YajD n=1 Tax=Roseinatronobacter alkalisoli TaxID=3028235 RepID=A0ABT5T517_9RHOB|nr:HNH endonuclease signature motif containing protein [Roseinatronobacter sp. HJB301]MDD7970210.1 HNH endonuclease signature motif containing protein [Roseinatronobacter sp. HJB301]
MDLKPEFERHSKRVTSTKRWQVLRMAVIERDGFRCKKCGARGRLEVDHKKPVRTHPELAFDPQNLQALCPSCHASKTRVEIGHPPPIATPTRNAWQKAVCALENTTKTST